MEKQTAQIETILQGIDQPGCDHAADIKAILNKILNNPKNCGITPTVHQTSASDGRIHTFIVWYEMVG